MYVFNIDTVLFIESCSIDKYHCSCSFSLVLLLLWLLLLRLLQFKALGPFKFEVRCKPFWFQMVAFWIGGLGTLNPKPHDPWGRYPGSEHSVANPSS